MATDATGTPTSLGIPTYDTTNDAPSGQGFNAAMTEIDTLLAARITKATLTTTGDILYASGASTPARRAIGSSGDVLTVSGGVPTWAAPAVQYSLNYATTLPASPADRDEAVLVDSTSNPTYQWRFRYNSSGATYKWEFIGGAPFVTNANIGAVINTKTQVGATGYYYDGTYMAFTTPRAGDYLIHGHVDIARNGGGNGTCTINIFQGSSLGTAQIDGKIESTYNNNEGLTTFGKITGIAASTAIGVAVTGAVVGTYQIGNAGISITPIRVS